MYREFPGSQPRSVVVQRPALSRHRYSYYLLFAMKDSSVGSSNFVVYCCCHRMTAVAVGNTTSDHNNSMNCYYNRSWSCSYCCCYHLANWMVDYYSTNSKSRRYPMTAAAVVVVAVAGCANYIHSYHYVIVGSNCSCCCCSLGNAYSPANS